MMSEAFRRETRTSTTGCEEELHDEHSHRCSSFVFALSLAETRKDLEASIAFLMPDVVIHGEGVWKAFFEISYTDIVDVEPRTVVVSGSPAVSFSDEERAELIAALSRTAEMVGLLLDALAVMLASYVSGKQPSAGDVERLTEHSALWLQQLEKRRSRLASLTIEPPKRVQ